jgi:PAS domain S-box-containing protein
MDTFDPSVRPWWLTAQICAGLSILVGAVALLGRFSVSSVLNAWGSNSMATPLDAGLLFVIAGGALMILLHDPPWASRFVQICSAAILVMAGSRLFEYLTGSDMPLDDWMLELPGERLPSPAAAGNRMGLMVSVNFLLTNASLLLLVMRSAPNHRRLTDSVAGFLGGAVSVIGLIHALGYFYGRPVHYGLGTAPMALTTSLGFLCLGPGTLLVAVVRDLSARRLERRRQSALFAATRALVESTSLGEAADKLLAALCGRLGWQHGALWSRDGTRGVLRCVGAWSAPNPPALKKLFSLSRSGAYARGVGLPGRAWATRELVWIDDPQEDSQFARTAAAHNAGLRGGFAVPIRWGSDEVLGVIEILLPEPLPPTAENRNFWEGIASQVSLYIKRKQAEQALGDEHNRLRSVIDNLPDHIFLKDTEGHYVLDNLAHQRFLGLSNPVQVIGKTVYDLFPPENAALYDADDKKVLTTGKPIMNREEPSTDADGELRWVSTSKLPFHDESGKLIGLICVSRDVTTRRLAEEALHAAQLQLIQAEKLESLGRLAAGIAHEVKNPLALILLGADYLTGELAEVGSDSAAMEVISQIREAAMRADMIIRGMLDLAAPSPLELRPTNLDALLETTLPFIRHEMESAGVRLEKQLTNDLPPALLDANKIKQVFINLCTNAVHAMPDGGVLTVRTSARQLQSSEAAAARDEGLRVHERLRAGDTVVAVEIEDTGTGVPPDKLAYIFEPFFTTKSTGMGTGLGLSVTKKIVELHGGDIRITNRPEGGARVTILFKANAAPPPQAEGEHGLATASSGAAGH